MVNGCGSKLVNAVSGVLREVFWVHSCSSCTSRSFSLQWKAPKHVLRGYADDSTLVAAVSSAGERVAVRESMNRDLNKVSLWCDLWAMKLTARKTKTMVVYRSRTVHPQSTHWLWMELCWTNLLTMLYSMWCLMLRWPLRCSFALFPVLQFRGLISWKNPGKYFMIGRSFWDLFGAFSCRSWSIAEQQRRAQLPIHTLNAGQRCQECCFLPGGVL